MHSYPPLIPHTQVAPTDTSSVSKHVTPVPRSLLAHTGRGRSGERWHTDGQYITAMHHGVTVTPFRNSTQTKFRDPTTTHILPVVRWLESRGAIPGEDLRELLSGQCSEWPGLRRLYSIPSHSETGSHHVAQVSLSQTPPSFWLSLPTAGITGTCCRAQLFNLKYEAMDIKEFPRESQWYLHFQRPTGFLTRRGITKGMAQTNSEAMAGCVAGTDTPC